MPFNALFLYWHRFQSHTAFWLSGFFSLPQWPIWNPSQLSHRMSSILDSSGCFLIRITVKHGWQHHHIGDMVPSTAFHPEASDAVHPSNSVRLDCLIKTVVMARSLHCKGISSLQSYLTWGVIFWSHVHLLFPYNFLPVILATTDDPCLNQLLYWGLKMIIFLCHSSFLHMSWHFLWFKNNQLFLFFFSSK